MAPETEKSTISLTVEALEAPVRLDAWLSDQLNDFSRSALKQLIQENQVLVDGRTTKGARKLTGGEKVVLTVPELRETEIVAEDIPLDVLFEDEHIIVINKPAGMVVHPAPGHYSGTMVNALMHHCTDLSGINGELRPGIVHRLDIGTTGVIIAAKNDAAHLGLSDQFQNRTVDKEYLAIVFGPVRKEKGQIQTLLHRDPGNRLRMAVVEHGGREAVTQWKLEKSWPGFSRLRVRILTGRTHQIRVHCAHIGYPIVGDEMYAGKRWRGVENPQARALARKNPRPLLHAEKLTINHPVSGEKLKFSAPVPRDMQEFVESIEKLS